METHAACPECGARLEPGQSCDDLFGQVLAWEHEGAPDTYAFHHLLVMSWEAQHPSRFSERALDWVRTSLRRCLREGLTAQRLLADSRDAFQKAPRTYKITRTGVAPVPRNWPRTIGDVVAEGFSAMPHSIRRFAEATLADIEHDT